MSAFKTYTTITGDTWDSVSRKTTGVDTNAARIQAANPGIKEPFRKNNTLQIPTDAVKKTSFKSSGLDVKIDNLSIGTLDNFEMTSAVDAFSKFSFVVPNDIEMRAILPVMTPLRAEVGYNGERQFNGFIETPNPGISNISIDASSLPSVLVDGQAPVSAFPMEFKNQSLMEISKYICDLFSLDVFFDFDSGARFKKTTIKRQDKMLQYMSGLARQRAFIIGDDEFGSVIFGRADAPGAPVLEVDFDNRTDVGVDVRYNTSNFYSHISGVIKTKTGRAAKKYTWINPYYRGVFKPHEFDVKESDDGELETVVNNVAARMFAEVFTVEITVPDWIDRNGDVLKANKRIKFKSNRHYIDNYIELTISQITKTLKSGNRSSTLECVLPGCYTGNVPEVIPWS